MKEKWVDIENYEHAYQISNLGRLKSKPRLSKRYKTDPKRRHEIVEFIRTPSIKNGYLFAWLYDKRGVRKMFYIHRLVAHHFVKVINGKYVDHVDGNKLNNNYKNLRWVSQTDNLYNQKNAKGFTKKGDVFISQIKENKTTKYLGTFKTSSEARQAYLNYKKALLKNRA